MKRNDFIAKILRGIYNYFLFFLMVAFLISCTMSLFLSTFSKDLGLVLTGDNLAHAAKLTFGNTILLSILFTVIDIIRRHFTTARATRHITDAAKEIVQGNFDIRIAPIDRLTSDDSYNEIIGCFNEMAQELQSVETLRTDFISNVSHEMKTPLSVIQNYGILLQSPDLTEDKRLEYAKGVTDASRRMADMMTNILKLNRLENQQIYPNRERFNLSEQLCECLLQFENVWEQKEIELETEIDEELYIHADAELLSLVWNNLFSNAFKFTPDGGQVFIGLHEEDHFAVITVRDTGCGMSADVGAHIFEKFYQGDTSHATQGNGLGLALVKRVVDILQGEISVESTLGKGTTFTVKIRRN